MEMTRLRQLAGLTEADERAAPKNLTVKPAGKDPMSVKHAAGGDVRDAAPANLTVKPAGKDPMSVKHAAGGDVRDAAPKNLTVRKGGDKSMKEAEAAEHDALVEAIVATINSIDQIDGLKIVAASIVSKLHEATSPAVAKLKKQFASEMKALKGPSDAMALGKKMKAWASANGVSYTEDDRLAIADHMNSCY